MLFLDVEERVLHTANVNDHFLGRMEHKARGNKHFGVKYYHLEKRSSQCFGNDNVLK